MSPRTRVFYVRDPSMRVFRSPQSLQRGYGIGGLFRGLIRAATPMVKKSLFKVGQKALNMGADALSDVQQNNVSIKDAVLNQIMGSKSINTRTAKRKKVGSKKVSKRKVGKKQKLATVEIPGL